MNTKDQYWQLAARFARRIMEAIELEGRYDWLMGIDLASEILCEQMWKINEYKEKAYALSDKQIAVIEKAIKSMDGQIEDRMYAKDASMRIFGAENAHSPSEFALENKSLTALRVVSRSSNPKHEAWLLRTAYRMAWKGI